MDVRLVTVGYDGSVQCTSCVLLSPHLMTNGEGTRGD